MQHQAAERKRIVPGSRLLAGEGAQRARPGWLRPAGPDEERFGTSTSAQPLCGHTKTRITQIPS